MLERWELSLSCSFNRNKDAIIKLVKSLAVHWIFWNFRNAKAIQSQENVWTEHEYRKPTLGEYIPDAGRLIKTSGWPNEGPEREREARAMARGSSADPAVFFVATLVLWAVSVVFEMAFNGRTELMAVVAGFWFFQSTNWAIRLSLSRDPLFVNTAVSLLHSTVTSCAGNN